MKWAFRSNFLAFVWHNRGFGKNATLHSLSFIRICQYFINFRLIIIVLTVTKKERVFSSFSQSEPSFCRNYRGHLAIWLKSYHYLFTLLHRGSDNSPLLIVFKWTLYELCICILRHDFDQSDNVFKTQCSINFWRLQKSFNLLSVA